MASQRRPDSRALGLLAALKQAPGRFDFYQALRRLECAYRDRPRLGEARHPQEEPVRLSQEASLAFAPTPISAFEWEGEETPRLVTRFFGLFGPHGPLPLHLTEYVRDRVRNAHDKTLQRFADVFHHRMLALYYRAFANAEPTLEHDRPASDRFVGYLGALIGRSSPERVQLFYAGRLAAQPKNAEGLAAVIGDFFRVPCSIEEFVGEWIEVPETSRWRLGGSALGAGTTLGARAWLCQGKFRVVIGPISQERFDELLPGTPTFEKLESLVKNYAGDELAWDVRLIVDETRQPWSLGKRSRLGWTTSLGKSKKSGSIVVKEASNGRD